jgi:hypothetical protein
MVGPSIREMAAEEARRRAMNNEPVDGDWRPEPEHSRTLHPTPSDLSPDFLTASAEFTEMWAEEIYHDDYPERG